MAGYVDEDSRRRFRVWLAVGVTLVVVIGCVLAFFISALRRWERTFGPAEATPTLEQIAKTLSIDFPPSAVLLHSHFEGGKDGWTWVKVEIDPSDISALIKAFPSLIATSKPDVAFSPIPGNPPWWDPYKPRKFRAADLPLEDGRYRKMLLALDDSKKAVLYIEGEGHLPRE